jgi:Kef-type K+ transport system membrane component KefB
MGDSAALLLLDLAVIIGAARLLSAIAKRLGQPPVVGEITAGVLMGPTLFGTAITGAMFPAEIRLALDSLAKVGLVLFMFIVGYEIDKRMLRRSGRTAVGVATCSVALPLAGGVLLAFWLADRHDVARVPPFVLFVGVAMAVTALPVMARILTDRGMQRTPVGGLALISAAVGDVLAWTLLAGVITLAGAAGGEPYRLVLAAPYVAVMFLVVRPLLRRVLARPGAVLTPRGFAAILIGLLLSCASAEWVGAHFIFGAFLFGVVMPREGTENLHRETLDRLGWMSETLLLPVFFVVAGLNVNLSTVGQNQVVDLTLILLVAVSGKFVGAYLPARLSGLPPRRSVVLATLMNTRGLTEIVVLTVGLQVGILSPELYSLMVLMAMITTMMAGPILLLVYPTWRVRRDLEAFHGTGVAEAGAGVVTPIRGRRRPIRPATAAGRSGPEDADPAEQAA